MLANFKGSKFGHWLSEKVRKMVAAGYDQSRKRYTEKFFADLDYERRGLLEHAPMRLLKVLGVTGNLTSVLWQVECRQRREFGEEPEKGPARNLL